MRRFLLGFGLVVSVIALLTGIQYARSVSASRAALASVSEVVETSAGPIEVRSVSNGKRVLLFLHGTPGGHDQGAGIIGADELQSWRFLLPSRPGYLRTPLEVGRTPAEQADALAALLDALGIDRVAVIGVSGGGPSALEFAARHPDRTAALVHLMGVSRPRTPEEKEPDDTGALAGLMNAFRTSNFGGWILARAALRNPESLVPSLIPDPENQRRVLDSPERMAAFETMIKSVLVLPGDREAGAQNDNEQFGAMAIAPLETIAAPTLVVHGDADTNVPIAMGRLVADRVPNARMLTIPGGDHFIVLTHAEEVFGAIFEFLSQPEVAFEPAL